ncbi:MAG: 16S rRNA (cytidine(1402)-2'-O)-methyltransferase [Armatimonadetes bacterium]|nr:16S rRNA (cytidine(1402)-2'-O)-methyltransferase [Armatimonadota bacterium]
MTKELTPGKLYIVATPIGNLEDITLRALRVLKEANVIAAEDTRVTRKLLSHYDIHTPMIAYHQHSNAGRAEELMNMLKDGKTVALVSDAGTPGISDPGHELITLAIMESLAVEMIPGATAVITALVVSGLPTSHFTFDGFPPRKEGERSAFFKSLKREDRTIVLYESPLRLLKTLQTMLKEMGDRQITVVREATKMFEEVFRGRVSEAIEHFTEKKPRGEIVVVIKGASAEEVEEATHPEISLEDRLAYLMANGLSQRDAVRRCMIEFKLPKRQVYPTALKLKDSRAHEA